MPFKFQIAQKELLLKTEDEFDDIWIRGCGSLNVRKRWVQSEYKPEIIAEEIKKALTK